VLIRWSYKVYVKLPAEQLRQGSRAVGQKTIPNIPMKYHLPRASRRMLQYGVKSERYGRNDA
jgi:hypothetical protein